MKHGKILALSLALMLATAVFAGCSDNGGGASSGSTSSGGTSSGGASSGAASSGTSSSTSSQGGDVSGTAVSGKLSDVHKAVKAIYGDAYLANMTLDADMLEEQYGIKPELVKDVIAEGPMMSNHVDAFIGIEAPDEKKADELEKVLTDYRDKIAADTMQYPSNLAKVQSARVERVGNYVFFLILGETTDEAMDMEDADQLKYYESEVQKAVDAIHDTLGV